MATTRHHRSARMALITKALKQIIDDRNLVITDCLAEGALRQETRLRKERMQAVLRGYKLSAERFGVRAREFALTLTCAFEILHRIEPSSSSKGWIVAVVTSLSCSAGIWRLKPNSGALPTVNS